ncbi:MAG: ketoacyl-ACP synthase III [Pseudonocardia sp.]|nr:ketoacyl-ACP synthase III [Pseudonocardia sp.]
MTRAAVLTGLGGCVPTTLVSNDMLAEHLSTTDEWIRTRTGIRQRFVVDPGVSTSDLAVEAGRRALTSAGGVLGVDAVILATSTPDRSCPATAPEVASRLGLGEVAAFDISAVCTGFVYALATAAGMISAGIAVRVLVIGADTFSTILNPADRTTRAIFGDGAGAVVLTAGDLTDDGALLGFDLGSDGSLADLITVCAGGSRQRSGGLPPQDADWYFSMQGPLVFRNAVARMVASSAAVLAQVDWHADDVDRVVAHQANARILHAVAGELGIGVRRTVVTLDRVGNTVAASIPLALLDALTGGDLAPGHRTVLTAFGGGLTWGSTALRWPRLSVEPLPDAARSTYRLDQLSRMGHTP